MTLLRMGGPPNPSISVPPTSAFLPDCGCATAATAQSNRIVDFIGRIIAFVVLGSWCVERGSWGGQDDSRQDRPSYDEPRSNGPCKLIGADIVVIIQIDMKNTSRLVSIFGVFALLTFAQTLPTGVRKMASMGGITEYDYPNGLKVLLYPDPANPEVTINVTHLVGSRHEGYGETGMAHLLERSEEHTSEL